MNYIKNEAGQGRSGKERRNDGEGKVKKASDAQRSTGPAASVSHTQRPPGRDPAPRSQPVTDDAAGSVAAVPAPSVSRDEGNAYRKAIAPRGGDVRH